MNPKWILDNDYIIKLKEYSYCIDFNIPLATSLDEADAATIEEFGIIKSEINSIEKYMSEK
mgnify:FL=1